ncbi:MAG: ABC transporter permease [Saprospiraceae bacterium]|nr:ABC transporter permease [Saprospiraceae bacterium]
MFDLDKWGEIFDSIKRHKLRTFLTALSVWWGIFMLIILLGAGTGLENSVEHNFQDDSINSLWMWRGRTSQEYQGLPVGRRIQFTNDDIDMIREELEGVEHLTGRFYLSGQTVLAYEDNSMAYNVRGVHPANHILMNSSITRGRNINKLDVDQARKVCLIGEKVARALIGKDEDVIGKQVTIGGIMYTVVGEFTDFWEGDTEVVYIPISTAQSLFQSTDRLHQIMMTVGDATLEESMALEELLREKMAIKHKFDVNDRQALYINNSLEDYQEFRTVFGFIKGFIWFVGIGSIIAGVIGVSNIMLIIVKDRTKEIGIRKAIGATPASIVAMILQESVFITLVAGYVGLLAGFTIIYGLNYIMVENELESEFFRNPEVNFGAVIGALILLVLSGALAGLIPALKAARISPIQAMKG